MYCRLSRSALISHGLCSISKTMPSYLAVVIATAVSGSAWQKDVNAGLPDSRARMTPLSRGMSAMVLLAIGTCGVKFYDVRSGKLNLAASIRAWTEADDYHLVAALPIFKEPRGRRRPHGYRTRPYHRSRSRQGSIGPVPGPNFGSALRWRGITLCSGANQRQPYPGLR